MATTNVLLTTFDGCASLPTICIPLPSHTTTDTLFTHLSSVLPTTLPLRHLVLTTTSNQRIAPSTNTTLADLHRDNEAPDLPLILPLRLCASLPGGKGGFGSQLRAAGGRMSSRKKRNAEAQNGSNRNLDGRRLRTITEAKNLATYLATKPEMDRREKEERRKRWEAVVEAAETREEEIRKGKRGKGLSEEWVAEKEEVGEGVRDAVRRAMMMMGGGQGKGKEEEQEEVGEGVSGSGSGASAQVSEEDSEDDAMELDDGEVRRLEEEAAAGDVDAVWVLKNRVHPKESDTKKPQERRYAGFDDDDEFSSSSDEDVDTSSAKGKAKA